MLTFYFAPGSSSFAAHIALHEVGADFEARPMSFKKKRHALAGIPEDQSGRQGADAPDRRPRADRGGRHPVLSREALSGSRAAAERTTSRPRRRRFPGCHSLPPHCIRRRQKGLDHACEVYGIADRRLGRAWALGERYSIADIHLFRLYWRLFNSLKPATDMFPNLDAHYARMMARPAVQRTIAAETAVGYELPA